MRKMKVFLGTVVCGIFVLVTPVFAQWELDIATGIGKIDYEERYTGALQVDGDWDATVSKHNLELLNYDGKGVEFGLRGSIFYTYNYETEIWKVNGVRYQTNDMELWGTDFGYDIGYGIEFEKDRWLSPFVGHGRRDVHFSRTNFVILDLITNRDTVSEDYNIDYIDFGFRFFWRGKDWENNNLAFISRLSYGMVINNDAENSSLGEISGDGGYIFNLEAGIEYISRRSNWNWFIGGFVDLERLEGGTSSNGTVVWPDNDLDSYGVLFKVNYNF